jgi:SlyX protein
VNDPIRRLEEKIAFLEHHVTAQDKVMLQFAEELARLRRDLKAVTSRSEGSSAPGVDPALGDERPPHY